MPRTDLALSGAFGLPPPTEKRPISGVRLPGWNIAARVTPAACADASNWPATQKPLACDARALCLPKTPLSASTVSPGGTAAAAAITGLASAIAGFDAATSGGRVLAQPAAAPTSVSASRLRVDREILCCMGTP